MTNKITLLAGRSLLQLRKHSPVILMAAGAVGFVGTVVLAVKATPKAEVIMENCKDDLSNVTELLASERDDYSEDDAKKDKQIIITKTAWGLCKAYGPAALTGATTLTCFFGAFGIMSKRNAAAMALVKLSEKAFTEYRERVRERLGEEEEKGIYAGRKAIEITDEKGKKKKVNAIDPGQPSMYARWFAEGFSKEWDPSPEYNEMLLTAQQAYFNMKLQKNGYVFLNDVYEALGFEATSYGQIVGWVLPKGPHEGDGYIDFGLLNSDYEEAMAMQNGVTHTIDGRAITNAILLDFNVDGVVYDKI